MFIAIHGPLYDPFSASPPPRLAAISLGFTLTLHLHAKTKNDKKMFNLGSPRFEPLTMPKLNQYQTIRPIHISC